MGIIKRTTKASPRQPQRPFRTGTAPVGKVAAHPNMGTNNAAYRRIRNLTRG